MRRDTIFRIASMTKPITAAAAMILVEECRLRLDDPVDELLPELADRRVLRSSTARSTTPCRRDRPITLRDLLTFRLGLGAVMVFAPAAPDPEGDGGGGRAPARSADARAGRIDARLGESAAGAPAGRALALPHRLRRPRRADRPRLGQSRSERSCASASSSRSA